MIEESKLGLEDLSIYAPYRLELVYGSGVLCNQVAGVVERVNYGEYPSLRFEGWESWCPVENYKMVLRPLQSIMEEVDGESPFMKLVGESDKFLHKEGADFKITRIRPDFIDFSYTLPRSDYPDMEIDSMIHLSREISCYLTRLKFDVYNLIDKGVAISFKDVRVC